MAQIIVIEAMLVLLHLTEGQGHSLRFYVSFIKTYIVKQITDIKKMTLTFSKFKYQSSFTEKGFNEKIIYRKT